MDEKNEKRKKRMDKTMMKTSHGRILSLALAVLLLVLSGTSLFLSAEETPEASAFSDHSFKVLLIGNSYSDDAADGGYFYDDPVCQSKLYEMLKGMLGEGYSVTVGLCAAGGVSLAWHATMADRDLGGSTFTVISDETSGRWQVISGDYRSREALSYTDWDAVVIQPHGPELLTGCAAEVFPGCYDFLTVEESVPFMIDHIDTYAPNAAVYLYQGITASNSHDVANIISLTKTNYTRNVKYITAAAGCTGTKSKKALAGVMPVGSAVQTARSSYLGSMLYHDEFSDNLDTVTIANDPVMGLQRDGAHLSFSIGRYIANLTFAKKLIPEEQRVEGWTAPDMRPSASAGEMTRDYVEIAETAVDTAIASEIAGGTTRFTAATMATKYKRDPTTSIGSSLADETFSLTGGSRAEALEELSGKLQTATKYDVLPVFGGDALSDVSFAPGREAVKVPVAVRIKHGYTYADITVYASFAATEAEPEYVRGDINGDGSVNNSDAIYLLRSVMLGEDLFPLAQSGDVNGDGSVNNSDSIYLLRSVMLGEEYYPLH